MIMIQDHRDNHDYDDQDNFDHDLQAQVKYDHRDYDNYHHTFAFNVNVLTWPQLFYPSPLSMF